MLEIPLILCKFSRAVLESWDLVTWSVLRRYPALEAIREESCRQLSKTSFPDRRKDSYHYCTVEESPTESPTTSQGLSCGKALVKVCESI